MNFFKLTGGRQVFRSNDTNLIVDKLNQIQTQHNMEFRVVKMLLSDTLKTFTNHQRVKTKKDFTDVFFPQRMKILTGEDFDYNGSYRIVRDMTNPHGSTLYLVEMFYALYSMRNEERFVNPLQAQYWDKDNNRMHPGTMRQLQGLFTSRDQQVEVLVADYNKHFTHGELLTERLKSDPYMFYWGMRIHQYDQPVFDINPHNNLTHSNFAWKTNTVIEYHDHQLRIDDELIFDFTNGFSIPKSNPKLLTGRTQQLQDMWGKMPPRTPYRNTPSIVKSKTGWSYLDNDQDAAIVSFANQQNTDNWHNSAVKYLDKFVTNYNTVVDIGANIGMFSVPLSKKYNQVHSFEINPALYDCLILNTQNYKNVNTYNYGASDRNRIVKFDVGNKSGYGKIDVNGDVTAAACVIDDYNFQEVGLIKIDVEGHEYQVLQGCVNTIKRCNPVLHVEIHTDRTEQNFDRRQKIFKLLNSLQYEIVDVRSADFVFMSKG